MKKITMTLAAVGAVASLGLGGFAAAQATMRAAEETAVNPANLTIDPAIDPSTGTSLELNSDPNVAESVDPLDDSSEVAETDEDAFEADDDSSEIDDDSDESGFDDEDEASDDDSDDDDYGISDDDVESDDDLDDSGSDD